MNLTGVSTGSVSPQSYGPPRDVALDDDRVKAETESKPEEEKETGKKTDTDDQNRLTDEELKIIGELRKRDAEVKAHEMAHVTAGGQYAGTASFQYQTGPNGARYAVAGEVPIDISEVSGDPEATIIKMGIVQRAALAPAEPSSADRAIAATASMKEMEARSEALKSETENQGKSFGKEGSHELDDQEAKGNTLDLII